jgi:Transmembrane protein 43
MADEYRETTTKSWGSRIVGSFMGIIVGIILFLGAFPLIFWNEGHSVNRIKTLNEGRGAVVALSSDAIDPAHNGALIHITGKGTTTDTVADSVFGVQETALKLKRTVEMYQWKESSQSKTEKNLGGSETTETTYTYEKTWSDDAIDSSGFKKQDGHQNPSSMPYKSETFAASNITLGAFKLSDPFISQINSFEDYALSQKNIDAIDPTVKSEYTLSGNTYFHGDASSPQVGAIRISYGIIKPTDLSVIGKQDAGEIQTYFTKNGDINLLEMGNVSADSMFASAESENKLITWLIRVGAFICMWIGLSLILGPISVFGDVIPFVGNILGAGIGLVTGVVALVLTLVTVAIAWIVFRPLIGIALLVFAGLFFFGGFKLIRSKLQTQAAAPQPQQTT